MFTRRSRCAVAKNDRGQTTCERRTAARNPALIEFLGAGGALVVVDIDLDHEAQLGTLGVETTRDLIVHGLGGSGPQRRDG
ncbi:MAG: hypothetical protein ACUVX8_05200 [Candidatus Zipacnadales bacterium]